MDVESSLNLRDPLERSRVLEFVEEQRPRLVIVAFPSQLWRPITRVSFPSSQDRRRLRKRRQLELPFLQLCEDVIERLHKRLPFGEWNYVEANGGATYCGKEVKVKEKEGEKAILVSQENFSRGR